MSESTIRQIQSVYREHTASPFKDSLTGLFTHGFFLAYIEQEIQRLKRYGHFFSLAIVDIDAFSMINHRHGAIHGDKSLKTVGQIIQKHIRNADIAARYAGDQFAILFIHTKTESAVATAEKLRRLTESESNGEITVSIGLSSATVKLQDGLEKLFQEAHCALKQAKIRGKNRVFHHRSSHKTEGGHFQPTLLLVDDEPLNLKLMQGFLKPLGYTIHTAANGSDALYRLNRTEIDLVLLDIMMPEMDGFQVCRAIKKNEETRLIPVVLLTALDDIDTKVQGIDAGADDFITKPPHKSELIARIRSLLRIKRLNNNLTSIENVLFSMAKSVEAKDSYTQGHVDRVSELAISIGKRMGLSEDELEALRLGGALHDVGKLGVPEEILNKPGPLEAHEWAVMKSHPEVGYKICLPLKKNLGPALDIIRHHHEKLDGSGYPDNLKSGEILMVTRILAVADIFDALTSDRPYRKAMPSGKALEILRKEAREGKIDGSVTHCLAQLVSDDTSRDDAEELNIVLAPEVLAK